MKPPSKFPTPADLRGGSPSPNGTLQLPFADLTPAAALVAPAAPRTQSCNPEDSAGPESG